MAGSLEGLVQLVAAHGDVLRRPSMGHMEGLICPVGIDALYQIHLGFVNLLCVCAQPQWKINLGFYF